MAASGFAPAGRADYGAFYTPPVTADFMVELLRVGPADRVLEPAAGEGDLVAALLRAGVAPTRITAWELDPAACATLRARFPGVRVERRDTLLDTDPDRDGPFERVIANPPYLSKQSAYIRAHRDALRRRFGQSVGAGETFVMFSALGLDLLAPGGRMVVITADTIRTLATHERLRRMILERHHLEVVAATPSGLFEGASVRTVILAVARGPAPPPSGAGSRAGSGPAPDAARGGDPVRVLPHAPSEEAYRLGPWRELGRSVFRRIDGAPFVLEAPASVVALFDQPRRLGDLADGHIGMHTRDNPASLAALEGSDLAARFVRRRRVPGQFRVINAAEAAGDGWRPYLKEGGDKDFWARAVEFVDWSPERRAGYVIPGGGLFGRPGLCVSGISRRLSARVMEAGTLWDTNKVIGLVPRRAADRDLLLGLLCSDLYTFIAKHLINESASLQISDLRKLPVPPIHGGRIAAAAAECLEAVRTGGDPAPARRDLDAAVYAELGISAADQAAIAAFLEARGLIAGARRPGAVAARERAAPPRGGSPAATARRPPAGGARRGRR